MTHGLRRHYLSGCRCVRCRTANASYETGRTSARIIPAARARSHLLALRRAGIGCPLIAETSGVAQRSIVAIRQGRQCAIQARTEAAILNVDRDVKSGSTLVPAGPTWRRIAELREEGFTETQLAERLGYTSGRLRFRKDRVTAATELKVELLYKRIMEDE